MKIVVWNLMRPNQKTVARNRLFLEVLTQIDPDIIILTETNGIIDFGDKYFAISTKPLPIFFQGYQYEPGENRVTIFSKFPFKKQIPTADAYSSVCVETETPFGVLTIYGTIIGFLGGRLAPFEDDLAKQMSDLTQLATQGDICFCGDLNISFSGRPYPSKRVVKHISDLFDNLTLTNLAKDIKDSAIHAVMSNSFLENKKVMIQSLPFDKKITDHQLVAITFI